MAMYPDCRSVASKRSNNGPMAPAFVSFSRNSQIACETAGNRPLALEIVLVVVSGPAMAAFVGAGLAPCNSPVVIQTVRI
jgi:hypothetical protein